MSDYDALKAFGHSPAKAAEIVLDAKRGDYFSTRYIAMVRKCAEPPVEQSALNREGGNG